MTMIVMRFGIFHHNYRQWSMSYVQNNLYQVTEIIGNLCFKKILCMKDSIRHCQRCGLFVFIYIFAFKYVKEVWKFIGKIIYIIFYMRNYGLFKLVSHEKSLQSKKVDLSININKSLKYVNTKSFWHLIGIFCMKRHWQIIW